MSANEDHELIARLYEVNKKSPKLVKCSIQHPPDDPEVDVTTWKMNEFKYYDIPSPFPTLARGLFTRKVNDRFQIVVRGYDKFFNIGEVPWNTWASLEAHTGPPYTLTLKSNGCIIFIGALSSSKLLVTSKHSLNSEHATVGREWLLKCIKSKGRTPEEFAATLWKNKWTAVAELCDDSFEEHVLPYSPENTGLHLHGLNACSKHFVTQEPAVVDAFAREWGLIVTKSVVLDSIPAVREYTERVGESGAWEGEPLEGFVVRTHVTEPPTKDGARSAQSPYAPGSSFFFKVKFDEPYMMYRDWREVTKALLGQQGGPDPRHLHKKKMQRAETKVYVKWVVSEIKRDRKQFDGYTDNKGIIATRERFQRWLASRQGTDELAEAEEASEESGLQEGKTFGKTIIVPVAIPGCGKTTVAIALAHLFGFGHTQSDDVHVKKAAPMFIKNVKKLLETHDVVIADKNNHLRLHRTQLRDAVANKQPPVRLLALNWSLSQPPSTIHRICADRVSARGANHQTLRADSTLARSHEDVIWQFLNNSEALADAEVDASVEMDLEHTPEQALRRAADACVRVLGVPPPSDEQIQETLRAAQGYAPKKKKPDEKPKGPAKAPRYYGLPVEADLCEVLGDALAHAPPQAREFWKRLQDQDRITRRPHITIVHEKTRAAEETLWKACEALHLEDHPPLFVFRFGHLLWNDRIMALTVDDLAASGDGPDEGARGAEFVAKMPEQVRERLHVTVGTWAQDVPPVEAKALVEAWRWQKLGDGVGSLALTDVFAKGRVKGLFN